MPDKSNEKLLCYEAAVFRIPLEQLIHAFRQTRTIEKEVSAIAAYVAAGKAAGDGAEAANRREKLKQKVARLQIQAEEVRKVECKFATELHIRVTALQTEPNLASEM